MPIVMGLYENNIPFNIYRKTKLTLPQEFEKYAEEVGDWQPEQ